MAKEKRGFVLYADQIHTFEGMEDDEAGRLIKHVFRYVNDQNPEPPDKLTKLLFEPIKQFLKRDLVKYEGVRQRNKENADKRWSAKNAPASDRMPPHTKNADSDKDIGKDKDNVKVKESLRSNVSLHRTELEKLQSQFSEDELNWLFDKLSAYKLSKGKTYKSDYGAICSWVIDRLKEEKLKEKNSAKKENGKLTNFEHLASSWTDIPD